MAQDLQIFINNVFVQRKAAGSARCSADRSVHPFAAEEDRRAVNHSVIVIDDEQDFLDSMKRCLQIAGIKNVRLESGPLDAVSALDAGEVFDVALIDVNMPGMNGKEVLKAFREKTPHTVCLMVTGLADVKFAVECMKLGAADYIQKPFTPDEFLATLNPILAGKTAQVPEKLKLLVVEDNRIDLKQYENRLSERIFEKAFAADGESASQKYREFRPDILVMDLMLPCKSGYNLLKEISQEDTSMAIIVISGLDDKEDILACAKLGIEGYLVKPVNLRDLNQKIIDCYGKKSTEKAQIAAVFKQRLQE
jgi:DNA-binding response OmpR family regulator